MRRRSLDDLLALADDSIDTYQRVLDKFKSARSPEAGDPNDAPASLTQQTTLACMDAYANVVAGFRAIRLAVERLRADQDRVTEPVPGGAEEMLEH